LSLADGGHLSSQITRDDLERMELTAHQRVYVEPLRARMFAAPTEQERLHVGR
jgi:hypothetical protein